MPDHAQSWAELSARLRADASTPRRVSNPRVAAVDDKDGTSHRHFVLPPSTIRQPWWKTVPAAIAVVALIAIGGLKMVTTKAPVVAPAPRTYETAFAQRAELRLTDGTRVVLAPGSRLRVATDFGNERRDLYLEGEAFFDVAHDELRPFTVYAGNASAHDVGTAFSVRSYAEDRAVQIVVREGRVVMSGVGPLSAGDVGRLTSDGATSVRHGADVESAFGWLDGRLVFEDAPLGRVLDDLRRWHHVDVELRDSSLATLPFTGAIGGLGTKSALELVARTLGLRLSNNDNHYILASNPGRTPRTKPAARLTIRRASSLTP